MEKINNGCVLISRQILENKIWHKSPAYFKIFVYILLKVNYKDGYLKEGEGLFNFSEEKIAGCTKTQVYEFLRWAKSDEAGILTTQKTTRGVIVKVNNYQYYQDLKNYKNQNTFQDTPKTQPKHTQHYNRNNKERKNTHTILNEQKSNVCVEFSKEERQILIDYARKSNARNIDAYINALIQNGGYKEILKKAAAKKAAKEAAEEEQRKALSFRITDEEREAGLIRMRELREELEKKRRGQQK